MTTAYVMRSSELPASGIPHLPPTVKLDCALCGKRPTAVAAFFPATPSLYGITAGETIVYAVCQEHGPRGKRPSKKQIARIEKALLGCDFRRDKKRRLRWGQG